MKEELGVAGSPSLPGRQLCFSWGTRKMTALPQPPGALLSVPSAPSTSLGVILSNIQAKDTSASCIPLLSTQARAELRGSFGRSCLRTQG